MPTSVPSPAERVVAAAIYAPIGAGARLVEELPAAATRVRQQLVLARFIGKLAVDGGVEKLRAGLMPTAEPVVPVAQVDLVDGSEAPGVSAAAVPDPAVPQVEELALPDYDQLPATQIVPKLAGLTSVELAAVEQYESHHRQRRTVLGKIAQLQAD